MPALNDYSEAIQGLFLPGFQPKPAAIKHCWEWRIPILVAAEMLAVSNDPDKMPSIPEARDLADLNLMRAEIVGNFV